MVTESTTESTNPKKKWTLTGCIIETGIIAMAVLLFWLLRTKVYETAIVTSGSMQPTLYKGDRVLVDHRDSLHGHYRRGDVIVFNATGAWGEDTQLITKRIIGLPGENWELKDGVMYINGVRLRESYLKGSPPDESYYGHLGATEYFVMGDNRKNSEDSRINGPIQDKDIEGHMLYIVSPLNHFGSLADPAY